MPATSTTKRVVASFSTFTVCAVAVMVSVLTTSAKPVRKDQAKDVVPQWPMFGGTPQRNMANPLVKNLSTEWDVDLPTRKNIKWVANLGSKVLGGPVVTDGRIFIGTNNQRPRDPKWMRPVFGNQGRLEPIDLGVLMCFRESDGEFLWQAVHEKLPGGQVVDWPLQGVCSSPVVEGDRLYYVSNRCEVVCANVNNGKAIWTLDMMKDLGVWPHNMSACSPLIAGELVMVVTSNGVNEDHVVIPAPLAPSFIAVDKRNGKVVWKDNSPTKNFVNAKPGDFRALANRGDILQHGQWSNPAFAIVNQQPQVVFPGGDGWLYAFDLTGTLIWKFDANPKQAMFVLAGKGSRSEFIGSPVIYKDRVYIGVGQDPEHRTGVGHFWCIDMTKKGDVSAEVRLGNNVVAPNPNSAAVWHYGGPINDPALQKKLRRNYHFGRTMSTCAIHEDLVYIPDFGGILHCLDASTGKLLWEHDTNADIWGSPMYADGKVYLGTDDKTVWVFQHGREKKVLAEIEMDSRLRTTPVANNGVLFIATENKLYAIHNAAR